MGSRYAWCRARDAAGRRANPEPVRKVDYFKTYQVELEPIPAWRHLSESERRQRVRTMCDEIEEEGRLARNGRKPVGVKAILATPLDCRTALPPQPWFEQRRRMICWADARAPETRTYLDRYWAFQRAFREASAALRAGQLTAPFPPWSFRPVCYCRPTAPPG